MEKNQTIIIGVVAVIVVVVVAILLINPFGGGSGSDEPQAGDRVGETVAEKNWPQGEGRLWVYGNANEDDVIDNSDVKYLEEMIAGNRAKTQLADANADGQITQDDIDQVKALIAATSTTKLRVYYLDNYFKVAKVDWPVKTIATGFSSGYYASEVAGVCDKIVMVDQMMYDGWAKLNESTSTAKNFGWTEEPDWEALLQSGIDVYVPGYFDAGADPIAADKLKGIDVMFMNTSDNEFVDVPNEHIDRSTLTYAYLVQGDMDRAYDWLEWHDGILAKLTLATTKIDEKAYMIQARTDPAHAEASYMFTGLKQTNNIHAEWAGVYAVGNHDKNLTTSNYPQITLEQILTVIANNHDSDNVIYFVDNENAGIVAYRDLNTCMENWNKLITKSDSKIYWLGMTRELGNSPLYLIEMIFYQNIMYPELDTGLDYWDELEYFIDNFTDNPELYEKYVDPDQWFLIKGFN